MEDYLTPLGTVPEYRFDGYLQVLEETVETKLENLPEPDDISYPVDGQTNSSYTLEPQTGNGDVHAVDRRLYNELLEGLEDIDSKMELMEYAQDQVDIPSCLPKPFELAMVPFDKVMGSQRANLLENVFEEAKQEMNN